MPKKTVESTEAVAETPVAEMSQAKAQFAALIENYKAQNPAKYELKKDELEKQLNSL